LLKAKHIVSTQWQLPVPVKLSHWTVVVPPPELVALAVEVVVVPPEVVVLPPEDADADADAEEEPLAVAVAEELVENVHVHAFASPPLNVRTSKRGNAKLFRTLIMAAPSSLRCTGDLRKARKYGRSDTQRY
jgi:hypothetical protein